MAIDQAKLDEVLGRCCGPGARGQRRLRPRRLHHPAGQGLPEVHLRGFDDHDRSIERARKAAAEAGVSDRCAFEVAPADAYPGEGYDLVAIFDASTTWATRWPRPPTCAAPWPTTAPSCSSSRRRAGR